MDAAVQKSAVTRFGLERHSDAMRKIHRCAVMMLLCLLPATLAFAETDEQLAMRFYPQSLDELFAQTHAPETPVVRQATLRRVDLDDSGIENYLAVAYSNGLAAELFLIRGTGSAAAVVDQADESLGGRGKPVLELIDIENDGIPELELVFMRETWLYKFQGGALVLVGPKRTEGGRRVTDLGTATYYDLDNDGILEIFEAAPPTTGAAYIVHKRSGGEFALTSTEVMFYDRFEQVAGMTVNERTFSAPAGQYSMQIQTFAPPAAEGAPEAMTSRPQIALNGAVVSSPMSSAPGETTTPSGGAIPVTLGSENVLAVGLPTAPETFIYVVITRTN
jgi:hypothetical protein